MSGTEAGLTLGDLGDTLYGVTSSGQFITLDYGGGFGGFLGGGGIVTNINTFGGTGALHQWAGLTAAPQNLDVNNDGLTGDLNDCLFAITTSGDIYCIDTDGRYTGIGGNPGTPGVPGLISYIPGLNGNPSTPIFPTINGVVTDHVSTGLQNASGLAFSPVDYNLWHPTELGATDPGHGIDPAPDNSRDVSVSGEPLGQVPGGASYYFGFENYEGNAATSAPFHYLTYNQNTNYGPNDTQDVQYGSILAYPQQVLSAYSTQNLGTNNGELNLPPVLAANPTLAADTIMGDSTTAPGGVHGELITNSFSLQGYSANDLPTLYFDYLLGQAGTPAQLRDRHREGLDFDRQWRHLDGHRQQSGQRYGAVPISILTDRLDEPTQTRNSVPLQRAV